MDPEGLSLLGGGALFFLKHVLQTPPEQAKQVGALADGVIVGSACVKAIGGSEKPIETAKQFAASFCEALNGKG